MKMDDKTRFAIEQDRDVYGSGFGRLMPDGTVEHIPAEQVLSFHTGREHNTYYTGAAKGEQEFIDRFRLDTDGSIVGHGLRWPPELQPRPGAVQMDLNLLNHLYDLAVLETKLASDAKKDKR